MIATAHPTTSPAPAFADAPASRPIELLEARQRRDTLKVLLREEQSAMADFLVALADFDLRRGWEALGHASLFAFIRVELGLSRSGAYWRLSAARLVQRFPEIIDPLRDGRLCMSTTAEISKVLTEENRAEVLPRFYGLSAREAQEVTAELAPRQVQPTRDVVIRSEPGPGVRLVVQPVTAPERQAPAGLATPTGESVQTFGLHSAAPARVVATLTRDDVEPLSAELRRLHVTVSRQLLKKLEAAREGLSHAIPGATTDQVIEAALDLLLEKQARARGLVRRPRTTIQAASASAPTPPPISTSKPTSTPTSTPTEKPPTSPVPTASSTSNPYSALDCIPTEPPLHRRTGPRGQIPAAIRRAVWDRDQGRCAWPLDGGGVCGSTHRLQLDHLDPWARWGGESVDDLRLLCERHNRLAARQAFGERTMRRYSRRLRGPDEIAGPPA